MYPHMNDPSWNIDDSIEPIAGESVLSKTTSGPLNSTKLDQKFHNIGIDTIIVAGVATDVCVTQTAREFADRNFRAIIAENACATPVEGAHDASLTTTLQRPSD